MNKETILLELQTIFRSVFNDEQVLLLPDTAQGHVDQWDSLNHAILIEAIEKHYNIKFDLMDMISMQTVGDICDKVIARKESK